MKKLTRRQHFIELAGTRLRRELPDADLKNYRQNAWTVIDAMYWDTPGFCAFIAGHRPDSHRSKLLYTAVAYEARFGGKA